MKTNTYLKIDQLVTDPAVERLLPYELARRYHALPIASDGEHITIAIAEPTDAAATAAVRAVIGQPAFFVQAAPWLIDRRLSEIRSRGLHPEFKFVSCRSSAVGSSRLQQHYFENITRQFGASPQEIVEIKWHGWKSTGEICQAAAETGSDLLVIQIEELLSSRRELHRAFSHKPFQRMPCAFLVPINPTWPIDNILLVIPDSHPCNDTAVEWAVMFASFPTARVSVLPILPSIPGMYGSLLSYDFESLIDSTDPFGIRVRRTLDRFREVGLQVSFKLRTGEPLDQLRQEIKSLKPDLIVIASRPAGALLGNLAKPLVGWSDCPVLFAVSPSQRPVEISWFSD